MRPFDIPPSILALAERLRTQGNRGTSHPAYCVQQLERINNLNPDGYDYSWHNCDEDYREATPEEARDLDRKHENGDGTGHWSRNYYRDTWRTVMTFLTLKGAEAYIENNGYNMVREGQPARIYVESFHRGAEMIELREWLMGLKP